MGDAQELRKLAEWYRAFAEVGDSAARDDRLKFAAYLDRKAEELERKGRENLNEQSCLCVESA